MNWLMKEHAMGAGWPTQAPDETVAEFGRRIAAVVGIHCGPSEYSPVANDPTASAFASPAAELASVAIAAGIVRPKARIVYESQSTAPWNWDAPPSRDDERRAIDALLREDARKTPAFATARKAAVLAFCEGSKRTTCESAATMLAWCREYEARRGGMSKPAQSAVDWLDANDVTDSEWSAIGHYERARGM